MVNDAVSRQPIFASIDVKQGKARYTHLINHTHTNTGPDWGEHNWSSFWRKRERERERERKKEKKNERANQVHEVQMEEELTIGWANWVIFVERARNKWSEGKRLPLFIACRSQQLLVMMKKRRRRRNFDCKCGHSQFSCCSRSRSLFLSLSLSLSLTPMNRRLITGYAKPEAHGINFAKWSDLQCLMTGEKTSSAIKKRSGRKNKKCIWTPFKGVQRIPRTWSSW